MGHQPGVLLDAEGPVAGGVRSCLLALVPALERLDALLGRAIAAAQGAYGVEAGSDAYRGLYVGDEEVQRLLARSPGSPVLAGVVDRPLVDVVDGESPLAGLQRTFGLSPFDLDVLVVALAPELDLRYERLYAYLQDDVTRRRPSVDLILNLLCRSAEDKLARRRHVTPDAPLVRHRLVQLLPDPGQPEPPLLAHHVKLDEQVVRLLLGAAGLDGRLVGFCRLAHPPDSLDDLPLAGELKRSLSALAAGVGSSRPLRLYLHGPPGSGRRWVAEALSGRLGLPLLTVDLRRAPEGELDVGLVLREARLHGAALFLEALDSLDGGDHRQLARLLDAAAAHPGVTVLSGLSPLPALSTAVPTPAPPDLVSVALPVPDASHRRALWSAASAAAGLTIPPEDLGDLAGRFRLTPGRIEAAVASARAEAVRRRGTPAADATAADLFAAARAQSDQGLAALARKVTPHHRWEDLVLPADRLQQLRDICDHVRHRSVVYEEWGFDRRLSLGKGLSILFAGPSGTGKTMAAEVVAGQLGLDLYKIDLSTIVSKYIGETEKHLSRVFAEAENANAILFFDEADALFGRRSEVRDSHDRYANLEISYLLQKMEEYQGAVILATNLHKNMDEAFVRRMHFTVEFPLPGEQDRLRIWQAIWPPATPRGPDLDLALMARRFDLAGGHIRNIAVAAAFLAAADGGAVRMDHVLQATRREYHKLGKVPRAKEFSREPTGEER